LHSSLEMVRTSTGWWITGFSPFGWKPFHNLVVGTTARTRLARSATLPKRNAHMPFLPGFHDGVPWLLT